MKKRGQNCRKRSEELIDKATIQEKANGRRGFFDLGRLTLDGSSQTEFDDALLLCFPSFSKFRFGEHNLSGSCFSVQVIFVFRPLPRHFALDHIDAPQPVAVVRPACGQDTPKNNLVTWKHRLRSLHVTSKAMSTYGLCTWTVGFCHAFWYGGGKSCLVSASPLDMHGLSLT
jgi:hypothetical protein